MIEKLRVYDAIISLTTANAKAIAEDRPEKKIILGNFNRKNKEHLFLIRALMWAESLYGVKYAVNMSWWDYLVLNYRAQKAKLSIIPRTKEKPNVYADWWTNFQRPDGVAQLGLDFTFGNIYEEYYEGSLN